MTGDHIKGRFFFHGGVCLCFVCRVGGDVLWLDGRKTLLRVGKTEESDLRAGR